MSFLLGELRNRAKFFAPFVPLFSFTLGFLVDMLFASGLEDVTTFVQHSIFLFLSWFLVVGELLGMPKGENFFSAGVLRYRRSTVHFCLGSLLSNYFVLFYRSSSILYSLVVLVLMGGLLLLNESKRFQDQGAALRVVLATFCLLCYTSILLPVVLGHLGFLPFLASLLLSAGFVWTFVKFFSEDVGMFFFDFKRTFSFPVAIVFSLFLLFYLLKWTPPIPMAMKHVGVYHAVLKSEVSKEKGYRLEFYKDWWRFWNRSEEHFYKRQGDELICFFRIFSPAKFRESLLVSWYHYEDGAWIKWDEQNVAIAGGRLDGYRGYVKKKNFISGEWRILFESKDRRVMAQLDFDVVDTEVITAPLRVRYF